jgi:hypothetical protein
MRKLLYIAIFTVLIGLSSQTTGVDVAELVSTSSWTCIKNNGMDFAIMRAYRSNGVVDANAK